MKQAVIAPSMLCLLHPLKGELEDCSREQFLSDLCNEAENDIRKAFAAGAVRVSIDFTEGRLAGKKDTRNPWTNEDLLDPDGARTAQKHPGGAPPARRPSTGRCAWHSTHTPPPPARRSRRAAHNLDELVDRRRASQPLRRPEHPAQQPDRIRLLCERVPAVRQDRRRAPEP